MINYFLSLTSWYLSKKAPKCCDPTNITPWECCHLYSKSSSPIKVMKSYWEHLFLDIMAKYDTTIFCPWPLENYPKETRKCWDPTNITSWECCHLYSKSSSPIKMIKSYWEHLFLDKIAQYVPTIFCPWHLENYLKMARNVEKHFFMLLYMILTQATPAQKV